MKYLLLLGLASLGMIGLPGQASAAIVFALNMTGAQEVPGPGDPDGTAIGTLTINQAGDAIPLQISWNFTFANIDAPNAMHIHTGSLGVSGAVLQNLGVATSGGAGTLISSVTPTAANRDAILANPSGHYVNIHNPAFAGGAVRGQLVAVPEPSVCAMFGAVGLSVLVRRRGVVSWVRTRRGGQRRS